VSCDWAANGNSVGQPKCKRKKIYYKRWFSSSASFLERQVLVSPPNTLFFSVWPLFRLTKHDACHNGGKKLLGLDFSHCTCHNGGKILGKHRNNEIFEFGYPLFSFCLKKGFSSVSHALDLFFTPLFSYFLSLKPPLSPPNSFIGLKRHVFSVFNVFIFLMPFKHTYLAIFSPSSLSQASESLWLVFKGVFSLFLMSILISNAFWTHLFSHFQSLKPLSSLQNSLIGLQRCVFSVFNVYPYFWCLLSSSLPFSTYVGLLDCLFLYV